MPTCSLPIATIAAPSTMPELLPAWWTWSIFSIQWYFSRATASKPAWSPMAAKDGLSRARPSTLDSGLMNSSWSSTVTPFGSVTGTTDLAKRPSAQALAARALDSTAKASTSSRDQPSIVAIRSAPMPWGTKEVANAVAGSVAQAPPSLPIATRLIDSTPPARIRSSNPPRTREAAWLTASRPEAQKRFSWTPATVSG